MFKRLQERRPRIFVCRRCPPEKPCSECWQDKAEPFENTVGAIKAQADIRRLSSGFNRVPAQQFLQKIPSLFRSEAIAEQAVPRAQTPCFAATSQLRSAANTPSSNPVFAPIIKIAVHVAVPPERSARAARWTSHRRQTVQKSIDFTPAFKETFHCPRINRSAFLFNRKRG